MLLVKDYLKLNNISISIFLSCDNTTEKVKNLIALQDDIWISISDLSSKSEVRSLNYENILERFSSPLSVIINLKCNESISVLEQMSSRKMFHRERFWLIFGESMDQAYEMLRHQFINMDAEIYLALSTNKMYSMNLGTL